MSPEDSLDLKGLAVESMFFKHTLDKLGVKAEVIHAGKYKDAGDMFTRTSMTPETREVLNGDPRPILRQSDRNRGRGPKETARGSARADRRWSVSGPRRPFRRSDRTAGL